MSPIPEPDCDNPGAPSTDDSRLYDASHFPSLMTANIDLTVQAMACGLTQVGVIQGSRHSNLLLSMARACGQKIDKFGDRSDGGLNGLFS